jgi:hypothetical protein
MTALLLAALLAQDAPARDELRELSASILDADGRPAAGLERSELALLENGVARTVRRLAPDDRRLTLAIVVDTSAALEGVFRPDVVEPIAGLLRRLPEGSEFTIWGTSDRPTRLVELTTDVGLAVDALLRAFRGGDNTLVDALPEAASYLKKREGARRVVLAITRTGPDASHRYKEAAIAEARAGAEMFLAIEVVGELPSEPGSADDRGYVVDRLTRETGGRLERVLTPMAIAPALSQLETHLRSVYRITYSSPAGLKQRRVRLEVSRPGARVALGESIPVGSE